MQCRDSCCGGGGDSLCDLIALYFFSDAFVSDALQRAVRMGMQQPKPRAPSSSSSSRESPSQSNELLQGPRPKAASKSYALLTGFPFPLGPTFTRDTVMREVDRGSVWVLEQTQA